MHKYFDIELFGYQHVDEHWWNVTFFRIASKNWGWHLFMIEQNLDGYTVQFCTYNRTNEL